MKVNKKLTGLLLGGAALGVLALVACESGSSDGNTPGGSDSGASTTPVDSGAASTDASVWPTDAGVEVVDAAPDGPPPDSFDSGAPTCGYPTVCPHTRGVGPVAGISGDTGSDTAATTGNTSEWITIRVTENDNGTLAHQMSLTAKLTSSPGTVYDVYLYVNDGSALAECTTVKASSTSASGQQSAQVIWGETGTFANGKQDDATVTIRVQHVSGPCDSIDAWKLDLSGHTAP